MKKIEKNILCAPFPLPFEGRIEAKNEFAEILLWVFTNKKKKRPKNNK